MIHIERGQLPAGAQAVALRRDGRIVVFVSEELSGRERLAAIREALRAAPAAGWRRQRSPVLVPALALSAGLPRVPESRWSYRVAVAAVAGAALLITAASFTTVSVNHGVAHQPSAAGAGRPPLAGAGPTTSHSATGGGPGGGRQPGNGSSPGQAGAHPEPGKTTTTSDGGGAAPPAPQASGTPAPVTTSVPTSGSSPQPSQSPSPGTSPRPSPSPSKQSGGSGTCVDVLGVTVCL